MFIISNVLIIIGVTLLLFIFFTFLNISTFSRSTSTTLYLTFIFFDLFIKMPFIAIEDMYRDREKIANKIRKNAKLDSEQKERFIFILQKRSRLFITLYKAGVFSYSNILVSMTEWYKNKPFTVKIGFDLQKKKSYESKYINDMKKEISYLEAF